MKLILPPPAVSPEFSDKVKMIRFLFPPQELLFARTTVHLETAYFLPQF